MRFPEGLERVHPDRGRGVHCTFQFSLWDSYTLIGFKQGLERLTFNSLYEIPEEPRSWRKPLHLKVERLTFNSLYEILKPDRSTSWDWCSQSFNSLYEIPPLKLGLFSHAYLHFQFSLWDSGVEGSWLFSSTETFQFSLWDSQQPEEPQEAGQGDRVNRNLSILFMRFPLGDHPSAWGCLWWTFNSLYEIPKNISNASSLVLAYPYFQFSLWDSPVKPEPVSTTLSS
jgi:hypothetical protein